MTNTCFTGGTYVGRAGRVIEARSAGPTWAPRGRAPWDAVAETRTAETARAATATSPRTRGRRVVIGAAHLPGGRSDLAGPAIPCTRGRRPRARWSRSTRR